MNKYNLGGHSGCQIFLMEDDDGKNYVRETAKCGGFHQTSTADFSRHERLCGMDFHHYSLIAFQTKCHARIYGCRGLYFFDMEYIQGVTLAEYIKTMEIGKVKGLVEALVSSLVPQKQVSISEEQQKLARDVFGRKLFDLRTKLPVDNEIVNYALDLLEKHNWSKLVPTQCHGDMTLENIIIKDDRMYFIDFLDSFYDSWFLDIGTLLQDVQVMWSYRFQNEVNMNTVLRLIVFRDLLLDEISKIDSSYVIEIYYSLLQKLIRIYPYTEDEFTYNFLNEKTGIVLKNIKALEEQVREGA